ncbi:DUF4198 domain-containing protein [Novosphingobium panipatense]|jgi:uncharacterized GH25 family protein|uniref:DUF4198 domain-containing protein n=1 Tax=Novosphingobium TaxID=165696 RepID=UPI000CDA80A8|nr:DUF4198 domain-containing protein [Novosphingobium sp. HII-3]
MRLRTILIAAAASSVLATPALAHRMWLLPSTSNLATTKEYVTVDAAVSNDLFYPDHVAMDPAQISVWAPDGSKGEIENAAKGRYRGTFDVAVNKPGTWRIGTERVSIAGTFKLGADQWRVGGRRPAGATNAVATPAEIPANATDIKLAENTARNYVYVTAGAPTKIALTGKGLEFDPVTHPSELVADEEARFRFLIDGKPAAGVKVTVVPGGKKYRSAEEAQELTTGADGMVAVKWPVAGWHWLSASAEDAKPEDKRASTRRMSFTTTLEVVAP